jgi:hypothetical protein
LLYRPSHSLEAAISYRLFRLMLGPACFDSFAKRGSADVRGDSPISADTKIAIVPYPVRQLTRGRGRTSELVAGGGKGALGTDGRSELLWDMPGSDGLFSLRINLPPKGICPACFHPSGYHRADCPGGSSC